MQPLHVGASEPLAPSAKHMGLSLRPVTDADQALLLGYRQECGWGEDRLLEQWNHPDFPVCVLQLVDEDGAHDVGMGGWELGGRGDASRSTGRVEICTFPRVRQE